MIFTDMIWISGLYRLFSSGAKLKARKLPLYENKKGKSLGLDSPFLSCDINRISQFFRGFKSTCMEKSQLF